MFRPIKYATSTERLGNKPRHRSDCLLVVEDAAALVAEGEVGGGFAAGGGDDFGGDFEVATAAGVVLERDDDGLLAGGDAVVDAEGGFGEGSAGFGDGGLCGGVFCGEVLLELGEFLNAGFVDGDVFFQGVFGCGEAGFGFVDAEEEGEFFFLEGVDVFFGFGDLVSEGLVFVVFLNLVLLGFVFRGGGFLGADFGFDNFFLGFELLEFGAGVFDSGFLGGDFLPDVGGLGGNVSELLFEGEALGVAVLEDEKVLMNGCEHGRR